MPRNPLPGLMDHRIREAQLRHDCVLSSDDRLILVECASDFLNRLVDKYVAGKKHHGTDLANVDTLTEAENEAIDLWVYLKATKHRIRTTFGT